MKIIKVEGCSGCPFRSQNYAIPYCMEIIEDLSKEWKDNPSYSHPDCPLEEVKE